MSSGKASPALAAKKSPKEKNLSEFNFPKEILDEYLEKWKKAGWPTKLLQRDHYSAKILQENGVFDSIKFFGHEWKWDDNEGLLILHKASRNSKPTFSKWNDILANISIRTTPKGEFLFDGATYGKDGLEYENNFQFSAAEFKDQLNKWIVEGWPVQFLLRDHYGAKIFFDNQMFQMMEFYSHEWKWDDETGISILFKKTLDSKAEYTPWNEIVEYIPICRTAQGWLLFDGWVYLQEGLVPIHLWQWKTLAPSYNFPSNKCPKYCYVDMVTFNWEHDGMPGIGLSREPHGHTSLEFGDDQGNFYSVGMYMDPRSNIDMKKTPAATLRAALLSPDPYLPSRGEKAFHRYNVGRGKEGRKNIALLKKHLEQMQGYKEDPETGLVSTLRSMKYHAFQYNCGDWLRDIEKFTQEELGGTLQKIDDDTILVPLRKKVPTAKTHWVQDQLFALWNQFLLLFVSFMIFVLQTAPGLSKKFGVGQEDDFSDFEPTKPVKTTGQMKGKSGLAYFLYNNFAILLKNLIPKKAKNISFPRRHRLEQLYSPRLKRYSALLKTEVGAGKQTDQKKATVAEASN